MEKKIITISVLGGTGKEGSGLALRWAQTGYRVIIGSRNVERAVTKAEELNVILGGDFLTGMDNVLAAERANLIVLSVPYDAHRETLKAVKPQLEDKVLVDLTVPLVPPNVRQVHVPTGFSAALEAQQYLGNGVKVVAAFQNVSAAHLKDLDHSIGCDVLVCSDYEDAKEDVIRLAEAAGMRGIDAGSLANAVAVEALTPVLLYINKRYKVQGAGIRITGLA